MIVRLRRPVLVAFVSMAALILGARADLKVLKASAQQARPAAGGPAAGRPLRVMFLGQDQEDPHNPAKMFPLLASPLLRKGAQLTYVATPAEAFDDAKRLSYYDAVMIYGNHNTITPAQEKNLLDFVEGGKGLIALHSASAEFGNSPKYIALVGAQFQRHSTGDFTAEIVQPAHPVMQGLQPFSTWDETYVHTKHNTVGRTVLMERVDANGREPWTWVRTQGQGRVFYTAYGHDERTWAKPEFLKLVENGLSWAVGNAPWAALQALKVPPVNYEDGIVVPNYERRNPAPKFQMPFSPEDAQKFLTYPGEFDVQLFASEPMVVKPITMTFDERGRLWVIEAHDYPNEVRNGQPGNDVIKILEDTNGDGKADKVTVFADQLNLPTSLTFANGGVIVAAAPNFLFLKDTNGDDKADTREIMYTGWGINDTHAGPSNLQYGLDNYIWGVVGYAGFNGQMNGAPLRITQGPYRFKPDGSKFEYMTSSTNNTWGLGFNETFDVFGSTANGDPSWYLGIPNRFFEGVQGLPGNAPGRGTPGPGYQSLAQFTTIHYSTPYIRQVDNQGYYTAGAGHMMYTARAFPKEYWNRAAFVNEPTVHVVGRVNIESQGAGYVAKDGWNLTSSAEEWFAPVHTLVGPDGAVWVDDWYNFIAQHNPTPEGFTVGRGAAYETTMRDKARGRIYRVVYKGAPPQKKRSLSKTDTAGLLEALASDNMFWRTTAQRLLVERGQKDVVPQLIALVQNKTVDAIGINGGAMHALWTLQGLGELNTTTTDAYKAAVDALKHPAAGVRKAAAMVLPKSAETGAALITANSLADPDLHTRLAVVLVMAEIPQSPAIAQALYKESHKSENFSDPWLSRAIYLAASKHQEAFLQQYKADSTAEPFGSLPVPLRMGAGTPDWRQPPAAELTADWKDMPLPNVWESRGLPNFDGVVWFTRTITLPAGASPDTISLGPVRNMAQVWVNGSLLALPGRGGAPGGAPGGARAGAPPAPPAVPAAPTPPLAIPPAMTASARAQEQTYPLPAGLMHAGANTITVRVTNARAEGGFSGQPAQMFLATGTAHTSLAGTWKYRVERSSNAGALYDRAGDLAAHVAFSAGGGIAGAAGAALPVVKPVPNVILRLSTVANEMKYATTEMTVQPGQIVEIVYTNPDTAPHNFVLGTVGSLETIGTQADKVQPKPNDPNVDYVPDMPQVLFRTTKLINPGETVTFQFTAPSTAGDYPYMCTYPAHWRLMNGVLHVVAPQGRGRGAGPAGLLRAAGTGYLHGSN